jgi:hypothetical protein
MVSYFYFVVSKVAYIVICHEVYRLFFENIISYVCYLFITVTLTCKNNYREDLTC